MLIPTPLRHRPGLPDACHCWSFRGAGAGALVPRLEKAGHLSFRRVIGIDASATLEQTTAQVARIARDTAERIGVDRDLRDEEITVVDGYAGPAYGVPDAATSKRSTSSPAPRACSPTPSTRASPWPA